MLLLRRPRKTESLGYFTCRDSTLPPVQFLRDFNFMQFVVTSDTVEAAQRLSILDLTALICLQDLMQLGWLLKVKGTAFKGTNVASKRMYREHRSFRNAGKNISQTDPES